MSAVRFRPPACQASPSLKLIKLDGVLADLECEIAMTKHRIEVICPSCQTKMVIDAKTGLVIHSEHKKPEYSFDEALERERTKKDLTDELFSKAFEDEKRRKANLEDKFKEALESKDELDDPSIRPWELD